MEEKTKTRIKKRNLKKIIRVSITLLFLIIVLSVIWFFAATLYKNKDENNKENVDNCLKEVLDGLKKEWQEGCQLEGKEIEENGLCSISSERASKLYEKYENKKNECLKENPIK